MANGLLNGLSTEPMLPDSQNRISNGTSVLKRVTDHFLEELFSDPHGDHDEGLLLMPTARPRPFNWTLGLTVLILVMQIIYFAGGFVRGSEKDSTMTTEAIKSNSEDVRGLQKRVDDVEKSLLGLQKDIKNQQDLEQERNDQRRR